MTATKYCIKCSLKKGHPGISFDENGLCNLCKMFVPQIVMDNHKKVMAAYNHFANSSPVSGNGYDCLLMLSGGKDSIYMLDKFVAEKKRKVLAYTFDIPFESQDALNNIEMIKNKIDVQFVLESNEVKYKMLMRSVFENVKPEKPGRYLDEKIPCVLCSYFIILSAFIYAYQHKIPFILYCADPVQMMTLSPDLKIIVEEYLYWFGRERCQDIFLIPIEDLLDKNEDDLPKIVYPFFPLRKTYDRDKIITELHTKGLYNSTPVRTHCSLFGLLNYYTIKNWDCMFYKIDYSAMARSGIISRELLLSFEKEMKKIIMDITDRKKISSEQKERFIKTWKDLSGDSDPKYIFELVSSVNKVAEELGVSF